MAAVGNQDKKVISLYETPTDNSRTAGMGKTTEPPEKPPGRRCGIFFQSCHFPSAAVCSVIFSLVFSISPH